MDTSTQPVYITDSYDAQTRRLTEQKTQTGTAQSTIDDLNYGYDHVGNVTSEADTPAASATDVQCFQYDYLGRLAQAWAQGATGCASTPSTSAEGGAAPYWNAYTYNTVGNLTGITSTTPTGAVTTTTDGYPAAGAARPHAISTSQVTGSSGSTNSSYVYDASGHLSSITATAQNEALTWNDAGQLTQTAITPSGGPAKNTNYLYDADGTLLLTADPGTTTLYLPDEELSLDTSTGTVTGTRYYAIGGTVVAARTGASSVAYLAGDQQGTDSAAIDSGTLSVNRRYYDPYGNPRGAAPSSFPVGEKGFVGGASDTATGLTNLGARQYQPGTGSFISPDPLLKPYDPQNLNAYAYSADNPSTYSDPSGAMLCDPDHTCGSVQALDTHAKAQSSPKGYNPSPSDPGIANRKVCEGGRGCAPLHVFLNHPDQNDRKPAPVTRPQKAADSPRPVSCGPMSIHLGTCIDTAGAGSGIWNFVKKHWVDIAAGIGIIGSALCGIELKGAGGTICDLAAEEGVAEEGVTAADQSALDYATTPSKLDHIFAAKHNFDPLVQQFGSREAVVQQFLNSLKGLTPESGTFEEQIVVGGQKVVVRGAVVNGVTKIGTAFTP
jgi:RHS repeat-associated protein